MTEAKQQSLLNVQSNLSSISMNIESNIITKINRLENKIKKKIKEAKSLIEHYTLEELNTNNCDKILNLIKVENIGKISNSVPTTYYETQTVSIREILQDPIFNRMLETICIEEKGDIVISYDIQKIVERFPFNKSVDSTYYATNDGWIYEASIASNVDEFNSGNLVSRVVYTRNDISINESIYSYSVRIPFAKHIKNGSVFFVLLNSGETDMTFVKEIWTQDSVTPVWTRLMSSTYDVTNQDDSHKPVAYRMEDTDVFAMRRRWAIKKMITARDFVLNSIGIDFNEYGLEGDGVIPTQFQNQEANYTVTLPDSSGSYTAFLALTNQYIIISSDSENVDVDIDYSNLDEYYGFRVPRTQNAIYQVLGYKILNDNIDVIAGIVRLQPHYIAAQSSIPANLQILRFNFDTRTQRSVLNLDLLTSELIKKLQLQQAQSVGIISYTTLNNSEYPYIIREVSVWN